MRVTFFEMVQKHREFRAKITIFFEYIPKAKDTCCFNPVFNRVLSKLTRSLPLGSPFGLLELCSSQSIPRSPDHRYSLHFISISEFGKNSKLMSFGVVSFSIFFH